MKQRKKKLKNYLKFGVFLFGVSLLLWNCESEEPVIYNQKKSEYKIETVTFNEVKNDPIFKKLNNYFNIDIPAFNKESLKYTTKIYSKNKTQNRGVTSNSGVEVNLGIAKKITAENFTSYTMKVIQPQTASGDVFYNVVLQENNGLQEVYTVKYIPTQNWLSDKSQAYEGSYFTRAGIIEPDGWGNDNADNNTGGGLTCIEVTVLVSVPCTGNNHQVGEDCQCGTYTNGYYHNCQRAYLRTDTRLDCYVENSNNTGNNNNNTSNGNPTGTGGDSSGTGNGNVVTTPVSSILPEGALLSIAECIVANTSQLAWINTQQTNNSLNNSAIWNYINENGCNPDTQEVITESIDEDLLSDETFEEIFKRKKECKKIKKLFEEYPTYKQALVDLSGTTTQNHENGKFIDNSSTTVQNIPQGTGGKIDINLNPSSPYITIVHTHDAFGSGIGTYSVFSFADLLVLSSLAKKEKIKTNKFVAILITAKGTRYALTINNTTKFKNFFYNAKLDAVNNVVNMDKFFQMRDLSKEFYGKKDAVIKENNNDNNAVQLAFLQMLQNNDTGVSVFTANASFDRFDNLKLEDDNTTVTPNNCNN